MRFPLSMTAASAAYVFKNKKHPKPEWQRDEARADGSANPFRVIRETGVNGGVRSVHPMLHRRFPLVLMLEPLHACNLSCTGCGRIREYQSTIREKLTVEQCLNAVDECGAPVVSICGGEPLIYTEIGRLVREVLARRRYIYLCTNGVFIRKRLGEFTPNRRFFFNVHLDGLEETHDRCVERKGVFREAVEGIKAAKAAGFKVSTNTTVYKETDMKEIESLFEYLEQFNVDGHMIAPGFGYSAVDDQEIFMTREDIHEKFKDIERLARRFRLNTTPVYLDFLRGERELPCTAWGNPTYNIMGWRAPCYLISDGHYATFEEFMTKTAWEDYGSGNDRRCTHCMMHCGYEPSAALGINGKASDNFRLLTWVLR
ncbi:MAG: adenosyl-hopene transferase HpnH [Bryobacteraceae bacterium]